MDVRRRCVASLRPSYPLQAQFTSVIPDAAGDPGSLSYMNETIPDTCDRASKDAHLSRLYAFIAVYPASPLAALAQARNRELAARRDAAQSVQTNPPAGTGETFMDGGRKRVAAAPYTTIIRVGPAKPAQGSLRLSPERLSNWTDQLSSGGSNGYLGYFPAPRVVSVMPVPGNALPAFGSSAPVPVLARVAANMVLFTPTDMNIPQTRSEAIWRQIENTQTSRVFQVSVDFASMERTIDYGLHIMRQAPQKNLMTLRTRLDYRGPQPAPRIERMLPVETLAISAKECVKLDGVATRIGERIFEFDVSAGADAVRNIEAIVSSEWMNVSFVLGDGRTMTTVIGKTGPAGEAMAGALAWASLGALIAHSR